MSQVAPWWIGAVAVAIGCQAPSAAVRSDERRVDEAVASARKPEPAEAAHVRAQSNRDEARRELEPLDPAEAVAHRQRLRELQGASEARAEAEAEQREAAEVEVRLSRAT